MSAVFVLKGYDPLDLGKKMAIPETSSIKTRFDVVNPGKSTQINNAGGTIRVLQRGEVYCKDGNPYDRECGKPCWWHRHSINGIAMGIPVRVINRDGKMQVYMDGFFCSYSCVMSYLTEELDKIPARRNPNYTQSKTLLLQLFAIEFPGEVLTPALDWKLLKDVGNGGLSEREWKDHLKGMRLVQHPNYVYVPVTVTYDILNGKN
jgi:hypothetical protein